MCADLLGHSRRMVEAIGDLVEESVAEELARDLAGVHEIELLHARLAVFGEKDRERKLGRLDEAAGRFRATAAFVRVSP